MGVVTRRHRNAKGKIIVRYEAVIYFKKRVLNQRSFETAAAAWHFFKTESKKFVEGKRNDYTLRELTLEYQEKDYRRLRKSTQQAKGSRFRYIFESPLAKLKVASLSDCDIDRWIDWLECLQTASDPSRHSFTHELKLLRFLLTWYREHHDASYVIPILRRHRQRCTKRFGEERLAHYYMNPLDVVQWLDQLKLRPDPVYYRLAIFMVLTGCRLSEAAGLCWDAVDLQQGVIRVIRTLSWDYQTKVPYFTDQVKTPTSRRLIKLPVILVSMLEMLKPEMQGANPVFVNKHKGVLHDNRVRDNFNACFIALNMPWRGTHICRHTAGTLALLAGEDVAKVQALLGHSSIRQTEEYAKAIVLQGSHVAEKTAALLGLTL